LHQQRRIGRPDRDGNSEERKGDSVDDRESLEKEESARLLEGLTEEKEAAKEEETAMREKKKELSKEHFSVFRCSVHFCLNFTQQ
jgi:hypothetical protein